MMSFEINNRDSSHVLEGGYKNTHRLNRVFIGNRRVSKTWRCLEDKQDFRGGGWGVGKQDFLGFSLEAAKKTS